MGKKISVILCMRSPRPDFLAGTLAALRRQTLPAHDWKLLVVDNASEPPLSPASLSAGPDNARLLTEPRPGLTPARLRFFPVLERLRHRLASPSGIPQPAQA